MSKSKALDTHYIVVYHSSLPAGKAPSVPRAGRPGGIIRPPKRPARPFLFRRIAMPTYPYPTSLRLPVDLKKFLVRKAAEEDRKLAQMIVHILEEYRTSCSRKPVKVEQ